MTPPFLSRGAAAAVLAALPGARAVGGAVRDHLAGLPIQDVDIAAPYPPEEVMRRLAAAGLKVFPTGLSHGTVTAVLDGDAVEVTSLRRDVATDGRHAEVAWTGDWAEDAARRDFTINAMSMEADGTLHDLFGGRADLAAGRVRFVGDPAARIAEDYLRALRFFRFHARYGRGAPDPAALAAIRAAVPGLSRLSAERVWMEIKRILAAPDPRAALALMAETGVLAAILPEAGPPARLDVAIAHGLPPDPLLRLALLLPRGTDIAALAARLRLSGEEAARLRALHLVHRLPPPGEPDPTALRGWAARLRAQDPHADARQALYVWAAEDPARDPQPLLAALPAGPAPVFPLQGRDALALGLAPGPRIGALLAAVREWWLEGGAVADHAACLERLRQLASEPPP
ncbi:MAG: CCA tRNA nucleotidyltransferase [Rhodovarius sp.]|nr:CCA tRNA nucleotidyltransferase [Rhodovarius sp.]